ncbi:hypothetical protein [Oceanobacillus halotolerans]|uniref:hypothetical protein n=1 Tax=Oceanobacillus halotolerans TaxID=2663380 RepID=UPI0013DAE13D|nr:hypothetical protein [Oceanobacillus halotolerans]
MIGILNRSKRNQEKVMIYYIDRKNHVTQRIIRVINIKDDVIVAYCFYRKKIRTFTITNILSAGPIQKRISA